MSNASTIQLMKAYLKSIATLLDTLQFDNPTPVPPVVTPPVITPPSPTPSPGPINTPITCFQFDIHCEKPGSQSSKFGVILSAKDFNILKQNDHYFAVIPANPQQFQGFPNISIHDLTVWIASESLTPVPDVPSNDV